MKKHKGYIIRLLMIFMFIFPACTGLDETVYDQLPVDEYGSNEKQINSIIAPIYRTLKSAFGDAWLLGEHASDMSVTPTRKGGDWWDGGQYKAFRQHSWTPSTSLVTGGYDNCMNAVSTCNQIYYTIENSAAEIDNREQVLAEIRGVRAFWYYVLIDNYGNVPIVTDFLTIPQSLQQVQEQMSMPLFCRN